MKLLKVIPLHTSEHQLVAKAIKNSRRAQQKIYNKYAPKMNSICRYYIKDKGIAEDVMITGFYKAFKKLSSFKNEGNLEGWLRKIMVRECISYHRSKKNVFLTDKIETFTSASDNEIESHYNVSEIQLLIDQLPKGYKMVFVLFAIEGYKHSEIANLLQISENTSKTQLFKARKKLQEQILHLKLIENGTK